MDVSSLILYILILFILYKICCFFCYKLMIYKVEGKNVFITGCDTGFGYILAKQLDVQGVKVFAGCLTEKGETELKKQCSKNLVTVQLDVTKSESVQKAYDTVKHLIPDGKGLWGLVNNAGITVQSTIVEAFTLEDYRKVLDVNLLGMIDTTVTFLPLIKLAKGRIVNMSSVAGRVAPSFYLPYTISKYGVECFSDALRRQLNDFGITVHIIEPDTHMTNIVQKAVNATESTSAGWINLPREIQEEYGKEFFDGIVKAIVKVPEVYRSINSPQNVVNVLDVNLLGMIDTTVTFLPLIKLAKGRIVNMSSVAGRVAPSFYLPYTISKYGVECFSDALRRQLNDFGITVHIIEPDTHMTNIVQKAVNATESTSAGWINLPREIQEEYGKEFFDGIVKAIVKVPEVYRSINSPQNVVNVYNHALFGLFPKARYMVGKDAYFWKGLISLPESMSDWILSKMLFDIPKPKSCRR